jgi:lysozyme
MHAISAEGLALIQHFEGFRAKPTQSADGVWVVGYGHVRIGQAGPAVSRADAVALLALDLGPIERLVNALVTKPLTQSQFDTLVSFAFSIGEEAFATSQVLRRVNAGDFIAAACAMDAWRKAEVNGELEIVDTLIRRRAAERALFLKELPLTAQPSALMRAKLDHAASILGAPAKRAKAAAGKRAAKPKFVESNVVALTRAVVAAPAFEPAVRLTEILNAEPATAAVLERRPANDAEVETEGEIVTAHAKPVARPLDEVRAATRRAHEAQQAAEKPRLLSFLIGERTSGAVAPDRRLRDRRVSLSAPAFTLAASVEHLGLAALLVFGLGLISLGASLVFGGRGGMVEIIAAAVLVTPGLAATLMAAVGLRRAPRDKAA